METGIAISSGVAGIFIAQLFNWLKSRRGSRFVTAEQCAAHRCALEKQIATFGPALERIFRKLDENDKKSEERTTATHRRLDPLLEKVAANTEAIKIMKGKL